MKHSAGLLVYRQKNAKAEALLVHPGGPFWAKKDSWSIPKGNVEEGENQHQAAVREFAEETGLKPPSGQPIDLGSAKSNHTLNSVEAIEGELEIAAFNCSSMVKMEWPPKSGEQIEFPEVDKAAWFDLKTAKQKIFKSQIVFIDRLAEHLQIEMPAEPDQQSLL